MSDPLVNLDKIEEDKEEERQEREVLELLQRGLTNTEQISDSPSKDTGPLYEYNKIIN
jgi:hypothetical protein